MNRYIFILIFLLELTSCNSQTKRAEPKNIIGGYCEGCEAIYEYGDKYLTSTDTLPAFIKNQPKLKITGIVFEKDGKTPAKNIILYIYHTNRKGIYETKGNETDWAKRHGFIRGWIKTNDDGKYAFYTFRPAAYPNGQNPEHIHITVKEPHINEYYIDSYVFDDDPLLTNSERKELQNRGGSGIVKPELEKGLLTIKRDIVLGLNRHFQK